MKLDNIETGMVVKNYKAMCEILGEEVKKQGKGRQLQIEEWGRYFDYEKQGHKFILGEIYATPLPKDFSKNDVYTKYVNLLLLRMLKEEGSGDFTMSQLLKLCGFVNENWDDLSLLFEYAESNGISYGQAKYWYNQLYQHVFSYCTKAISRCLDRLEKRGFLIWNKRLWLQIDGESRLATDGETKDYLNMKMAVREDMGIKYINVYNRDEYYGKLDSKLKEHGWERAYTLIHIIYATDFIDKIIKESQEEYREALLSVNGHCLEQMHKYIDTDIEKDIKKFAEKGSMDIEIARLSYDVEGIKSKKTDITDMYVEI